MRGRLFALAAGLVILASSWSREPGRALAPVPHATPREAQWSRPILPSAEPTPWPATARDPFRFEAEETREPPARSHPVDEGPATVTPSPAPSPPSPLRLVGLVRRTSGVRAAIALDGEVSLVTVGDRVLDFTVLAVEDEGTVRLRDGDGADLTLTLPEGP